MSAMLNAVSLALAMILLTSPSLAADGTAAVTPPAATSTPAAAAAPAEPALDAKTLDRIEAMARLALDRKPADKPAFIAGLADANQMVRRHAIYGLERLGDPTAAKELLPLLKDPEPWVRRNAAIALGKLRNPEAVAPLMAVLGDQDVYLRFEALLALGRIGDPATQPAIIKAMQDRQIWTGLDIWSQVAVLHVVERKFWTDKNVVPVLKTLLDHGTWDHPEWAGLAPERRAQYSEIIANSAAQILARFGDAAGEESLIKGLQNVDDDYRIQGSAMALALLKTPRAVPHLEKVFETEWLTNWRYAARALKAIGTPEAVAALKKLQQSDDVRKKLLADDLLGEKTVPAEALAAAKVPEILAPDMRLPGDKRPPQFICLGVDDCANIEGLESILDICETLQAKGSKVVFTLWLAPLSGDYGERDVAKQTLILRRLFDMGCEIAHHTLHHNPGGRNWSSLPKEQQLVEIDGATQWYRDNLPGFTRPFTHKGGGGGKGAPLDRDWTRQLIAKQNFLYWGRRGNATSHPNTQAWPTVPPAGQPFQIDCGCLDAAAPPVHAKIFDPTTSDYSGRFDYEIADGVKMYLANFDYRYQLPQRPILAVNAFHDWGFKSDDDSTTKSTHRNEAAILKAFLIDVLVTNKAKYPEAHCVTFRQVVEYVLSNGDLKHTLAAGNCQDSRNPEKPKVE